MPLVSGSRESASLADFFEVVRQRKALIGLLFSLVVVGTLVFTAFQPKWYLSTTKVKVEKPEGEVKLFQSQGNSASYDPYFLQDQFRIMQSEKILYPVIAKLELNEALAASLGLPGAMPNQATFNYLLQRMLRLETPRNSSVIEINVYAQDPVLAARIANEIARTYSDDRIAFATSEQREGLAKIREELAAQEKLVEQQRNAVEKLRSDLNLSGINLNRPAADLDIESIQQLQASLNQMRADASARETRHRSFREIPPADRIALVNAELIPDPNIQKLHQDYLAADQNVTRLQGSNLGAEHPDMIAARESRNKMREQLDAQLAGFEKTLEIQSRQAQAAVAQLERSLEEARSSQIQSAQEKRRPFEDATRTLDDETLILTTLKTRLREREIDFQAPKRSIEILNTAEPGTWPSRPNWTVNVIASVLFGGLLALGVALSLEYLDTSFRNMADVETRLGIPVLGVIPSLKPGGPPSEAGADSAESEPYRVLQTNLDLMLKPGGGTRALAFFSAGPGEGKSTTLNRLALLMGRAGERVLVIDSDVRRPTQHRLWGRSRDPGLGDILVGNAAVDAVIQRGVATNVDFIPSGARPNFTLSLVYLGRLKEIIGSLRGRYDRIILDSPPIIGVSDASVVASAVDGTILLIQHRRNPARMVQRAHQILESLKVPVLGAVLNQVPVNSGEDYGYYTSNYGSYGEPAKETPPQKNPEKSAPPPDRLKLD